MVNSVSRTQGLPQKLEKAMNCKQLNTTARLPDVVRRAWLLATALAVLPLMSMAVPPALLDQYGNSGGMEKFSGEPVIVFVTSLTQLPKLGKWEEAIRPQLPTINTLDIGDIDTSSKFIRSAVERELKKHVPDGVSVYIDPENLWAKEYDLDLGEPCVLIFDADHALVKQFRGKPEDELLAEVIAEAEKYFPPPTQ